ncbi:major centromere autoantigen B-like [Polyodon spathula]|uniref:major centromere autoantigen B-like n=1 Tax=Polyodon spathula TaxID=7913 RepID=UPI001B7DE7E5|nr:major centromere autoantigen B-like [Polyodon spathula]XP_041093920.1 major centromere autoantigen B-like [Polyodon spathula]
MGSSVKKRTSLSLREKVRILAAIDGGTLPRMGQRELAKRFGLSQPSLCQMLKSREAILRDWAANQNPERRRRRTGKDAEVEGALLRWFQEARPSLPHLSVSSIMQKAEALASEMGKKDFVATDGWISRWKKRNNIRCGRGGGGGGRRGQAAVKEEQGQGRPAQSPCLAPAADLSQAAKVAVGDGEVKEEPADDGADGEPCQVAGELCPAPPASEDSTLEGYLDKILRDPEPPTSKQARCCLALLHRFLESKGTRDYENFHSLQAEVLGLAVKEEKTED